MNAKKEQARRERVAMALIAEYSFGFELTVYREIGWDGLKRTRHPELMPIRKKFLRMAAVALKATDKKET